MIYLQKLFIVEKYLRVYCTIIVYLLYKHRNFIEIHSFRAAFLRRLLGILLCDVISAVVWSFSKNIQRLFTQIFLPGNQSVEHKNYYVRTKDRLGLREDRIKVDGVV